MSLTEPTNRDVVSIEIVKSKEYSFIQKLICKMFDIPIRYNFKYYMRVKLDGLNIKTGDIILNMYNVKFKVIGVNFDKNEFLAETIIQLSEVEHELINAQYLILIQRGFGEKN